MRTLKLTHEEIELIKEALTIAYDKNSEIIRNNRKLIGEKTTETLLKRANSFLELQDVFDGERDV